MSPFRRINILYNDDEYKVRVKAPILFAMTIAVSLLLILITLVNIIRKEPMTRVLLDFLIIISSLFSCLLIFKHKYNQATTIFLSGIFLGLTAIYISQSFVSKQLIHANALTLNGLLIITVLFSNSKKQTLFFSLASLSVLIISSIIAILTDHIYTEYMAVISQMITPLIFL
ncbi:MAG: hypothetical protein PF518_18575 [Spirochaetaceae bacterium]|jgi:O-antigen ligase|nr:hypothetical protein [Spirochaetaceae bacterium]